ncbi:MAG: N-formylglutamate amidohydrolase [Deferribacteres bacterium]|nr:N-formylglutamate amidohydrolase [candidate division KSB1 bacterium]MCB9503535.1 N-formylglutamate amidohydrolase [Deferribacteres bacterium]
MERETNSRIWQLNQGETPLVTAAIHNGHNIRREVADIIALSAEERLREEDPFTWEWTIISDTQIIGLQSRFEVDLNEPRETAVNINPEQAWGLQVWKRNPSLEIINRSLAQYDAFYAEMHRLFSVLEKTFGHFVVFDLHSYNHRQDGINGNFADPALNPEVNIGTGTMKRLRWALLVDRFIADLRAYKYNSRHFDVRENIRFRGGEFPRWIHANFPHSGCCISIAVKKFFMDEWTGDPYGLELDEIRLALKSTIPGVKDELEKLKITSVNVST